MGMRLGEGSGAALAMPIVEAACAMYHAWACWRRAILCYRRAEKGGERQWPFPFRQEVLPAAETKKHP
jgi:hypothetical protein